MALLCRALLQLTTTLFSLLLSSMGLHTVVSILTYSAMEDNSHNKLSILYYYPKEHLSISQLNLTLSMTSLNVTLVSNVGLALSPFIPPLPLNYQAVCLTSITGRSEIFSHHILWRLQAMSLLTFISLIS